MSYHKVLAKALAQTSQQVQPSAYVPTNEKVSLAPQMNTSAGMNIQEDPQADAHEEAIMEIPENTPEELKNYIQDLELIAAMSALGVMSPEEQKDIDPIRVIALTKMVLENEARINKAAETAMKQLGLFKN